MSMRTGQDSRGGDIAPTDYLNFFYRDDREIGMWSSDRMLVTRDTDLWETQEEVLVAAFDHHGWPPGVYRVVTFANYSRARVGALIRPLPLPPGYARLGKSPYGDLPARAFALTVLERYPDSTLEVVGEHIAAFARHWHGAISTARLAELTGYTLPSGVPRPHHPEAEITLATR